MEFGPDICQNMRKNITGQTGALTIYRLALNWFEYEDFYITQLYTKFHVVLFVYFVNVDFSVGGWMAQCTYLLHAKIVGSNTKKDKINT